MQAVILRCQVDLSSCAVLRCAVLCVLCHAVKGGKRSARDSQYIRSILTGVNPAAPGDGQVCVLGARRWVCFLAHEGFQQLRSQPAT